MHTAKKIGLTGGIGSGKSTVSAILAEHGATIIDADAISRRMTAVGGAALPPIQSEFGPAAIDSQGALNRPYMRDLIFQDTGTRQRLEAIIHPLVRSETRRQIQQAEQRGAPLVIIDMPLLVESRNWQELVDAVLVVDCEEATQIQRVMARSQLEHAAVERIIAAQASRTARKAVANWVIYNDGIDLAQLRQEVLSILAQMQL